MVTQRIEVVHKHGCGCLSGCGTLIFCAIALMVLVKMCS